MFAKSVELLVLCLSVLSLKSTKHHMCGAMPSISNLSVLTVESQSEDVCSSLNPNMTAAYVFSCGQGSATNMFHLGFVIDIISLHR